MTKKQLFLRVTLVIAIVGGAIIITGFYGLIKAGASNSESSNERDNRDPVKRLEMARVTYEWGRLAEFPESKIEYTIQTEGSSFTRAFRGSFRADPDVIQRWILDSPGIQEGAKEPMSDQSSRYILKMGGGASFGEVIVSSDQSEVSFYVTWS